MRADAVDDSDSRFFLVVFRLSLLRFKPAIGLQTTMVANDLKRKDKTRNMKDVSCERGVQHPNFMPMLDFC